MSIEKIGINSLSKYISYSQYLEPYFDENDKTPSWDGQIYVYKKPGLKKRDFLGYIPAQVKTRTVQKFSKLTRIFDLKTEDLNNYYLIGGTILFIVEINEGTEKYFYRELLPSDINEIRNKFRKPEQKQVRIKLNYLDTSSVIVLESICKNFIINRTVQYSTKDCPPLKFEDAIETKIHFFTDGILTEKYLFTNEIPLYGRQIPQEAERFITNIKIESIHFSIQQQIVMNSKVYYQSYEAVKSIDKNRIKFGNDIFFEAKTNTLEYKPTGNYEQKKTDVTFLIDLIENGSVSIGKHLLNIKKSEKTENFKNELIDTLNSLKDIEKLFSLLGINWKTIDVNQIDDKCYSYIDFLIKTLVNKQQIENTSIPFGFNAIKLGNIVIGIFVTEDRKNNQKQIINIFGQRNTLELRATTKEGEQFIVSPFIYLKSDFLILIDNLNLDFIWDDIKRFDCNHVYANDVNFFALELLKAFDKTGRREFLKTSLEIFIWLQDNYMDVDINKLNELQTIRREREFVDTEKQEILDIRIRNADNNKILCGVNILLQNRTDARIYFDKLTNGEKEQFLNFPIYFLAQELGLF